jgi:indolepyruvate ferredoxin oxidoreductase, beta subunit
MKYDTIVAGVGGQGALSVAAIIARSAIRAGLHAVQSEVHGMSQRGGEVVAHLRIASREIRSSMIAKGQADLILGLEPLESLRHLELLSRGGTLLTATEPLRNIPNYPQLDDILSTLMRLPRTTCIDASYLARQAGSARAANIVMIGAASDLLPMDPGDIRVVIEEIFRSKGVKVVQANLAAFDAGRSSYRQREVVDEYETFAGVS